jgi:hypothetical protein
MLQLRFFDLSRRYECLDANNDPLAAIVAISRGKNCLIRSTLIVG